MKVQELLQDPKKWTQKAMAKDSEGNEVSQNNPAAVCFCLLGAIFKCYPNFDDALAVRRVIFKNYGMSTTTTWNDTPIRTHKEVLALAIQLDI